MKHAKITGIETDFTGTPLACLPVGRETIPTKVGTFRSLRLVTRFSKGFTLVELLVVIAIISIMSTIVIVSFGSGRQQKEVEGAASEVMGVLREAQGYALTGKTDPTNPDRVICWFGLVGMSGSNYVLTYGYRDGSGNCIQSPQPLATYTLRGGVSIAASADPRFYLPHGVLRNGAGMDLIPGNNISIRFSKSGESHMVCLYLYGRIESRAGTSCP